MDPSSRRRLAAAVVTGALAVGAVVVLLTTARDWYTPVVEAVGSLAAAGFLWLGLRWTVSRLDDMYGG